MVIYTLGAGLFVQSLVVWGFRMKNRRFKGLSIKTAMALYSVIAISVLTIVISGIGYHMFEKNVKENYQKYARTVLDNAYSIVELCSFGDMIADRDMPADYEKMRGYLNSIKENSDIEYLYAIYFDDIRRHSMNKV